MSPVNIVALDIKREARELASELGAHHTLDPSEDDIVQQVMDITDAVGAHQIVDFVGRDETTELGPQIATGNADHHIVGYGGHIHQPAQTLVSGEFGFRGTLVGKYTELQELMALVDRGDVELHTSQYDLSEINEVAEKLEHGEIEGRAVITP
jgi:D-arabinose 1-dehydrogenase-like Zn-dependent alcohol dehydrogenase